MGLLRSGLITVVVSGSLGVLTVIGCSADGSTGALVETTPLETAPPEKTASPTDSGGPAADAGKPDAKKDASVKESGPPDAGPPAPVPDTPCTTVDEERSKSCGACGTAATICLATLKWAEYSPCQNEKVGGCTAGTVVDMPCGTCGTQKRICSQFCAYSTSACIGEPVGGCVPGSVELKNAGCPSVDVFRQRTCTATCSAPSFSLDCSPPPTVVEVGPVPGNVTSTIAILTTAQTMARINGSSCPTTILGTVVTPYVYLQVHNPLATSATIAIYNSLAPGGVPFKTALAAYDGVVAPTDELTRKVCQKAATVGTAALTGDLKFASLDNTRAVTIAAGATVSVYVAAFFAYDPLKPTDSTGNVKLNVATVLVE